MAFHINKIYSRVQKFIISQKYTKYRSRIQHMVQKKPLKTPLCFSPGNMRSIIADFDNNITQALLFEHAGNNIKVNLSDLY